MAEVVNLRQARKARQRIRKEDQAAENRAIHGRPGAERRLKQKIDAKAASFLDGHRRVPREDEAGG